MKLSPYLLVSIIAVVAWTVALAFEWAISGNGLYSAIGLQIWGGVTLVLLAIHREEDN